MKRTCSIPGCERPHKAHGYCKAHYTRLHKHGDPLGGATERGAAAAFLASAASFTDSECLIWPFTTNGAGYGLITVDGRLRYVHRIVCESANGPPPTEHHHAAHDNNGQPCISQCCVNPNHLRWATPSENCLDKALHGTAQIGEQNPVAKLSEQNVREIRALKGSLTQREIAQMFGVARETVRNIHAGSRWRVTQ